MGGEELVKNVMAAINGIAEIVPRKWGGIRSFHLKLLESLALPIYQALPDFKLKIEGVKEEEEKEEKVEGTNVKEEKKVGRKKGRIHEIRYMDNTASEDDDEVLLDKGEGDVDNDDGDSEVIMGTDGLEGKKRKKGDVGKVEKKLKKTKLKKEDGVKGKKKLDNMKNEDSLKKKKSKKAA
ncbi:conserved hypothetical protein [Ricinus communis]|uniref:Uncharacterized protein n=1 Tax=Ricinus communis TaxID=3988 RepID=B9S6Q7_RICCO|nr:conserved hypothetical protein [Ricinus communis]|eukprot:XP_002521676.1 ribosomal L1 domain-containing protein 1 [Ricinus communis]